jgi:Tfp pilus assembly protein PilZ
MLILYPLAANFNAIALPMPLVAPVITAFICFISNGAIIRKTSPQQNFGAEVLLEKSIRSFQVFIVSL